MTEQLSDSDVRVEFTVDAPIETAYRVFTEGIDTWWPRSHHIGKGELTQEVIEPFEGGRCYGREADGTECQWGTVQEWQPPHRFGMTWEIGLDWQHQPNPDLVSRVIVTFAAETPERTQVTLVHTDLARHGEGWEAMRNSVASDGGWPDLANTYAKAAASA